MTFDNKFLGKPQDRSKNMSESEIEERVCNYAKRQGVIVDKFTSPAKRSVPDRLLIFPNGVIIFIEFKAPGKKPTEKQKLDHEKRRANNALVYVIDDVDQGKNLVGFFLEMGC